MALETAATSFQNLFNRVQRLEQTITSPEAMPGANQDNIFPDGIYVGPPGSEIYLSVTYPELPTNLTYTVGAFEEQAFADLSWTPGAESFSYQVEVARKIGTNYEMSDKRTTVGTTTRVDNLQPGQIYGFRVAGVSRTGVVGPATAYTDFTAATDSTAPPVINGLFAFRGAASVVASWNPSSAADVKNGHGLYLVELSSNSFATVMSSARTGATVHVFEGITFQTTYQVRVRAIDSSGNEGPTATASATAGGIVKEQIVAGEIITAHMKVGEINANVLLADSAELSVLKTNSILTKNLQIGAGGQFVVGTNVGGTTNGQGMYVNSQGISLYNTIGERVVYLDALTGAATFTGTVSGGIVSGAQIDGGTITGATFRTATSGMRMHMGNLTGGTFIQFFSGVTSETQAAYIGMKQVNPLGANRTSELSIQGSFINGVTITPHIIFTARSVDATIPARLNLYAAGSGGAATQIALIETNGTLAMESDNDVNISVDRTRVRLYNYNSYLDVDNGIIRLKSGAYTTFEVVQSEILLQVDPDTYMEVHDSSPLGGVANSIFIQSQDQRWLSMANNIIDLKYSNVPLRRFQMNTSLVLLNFDADTLLQMADNDVLFQSHGEQKIGAVQTRCYMASGTNAMVIEANSGTGRATVQADSDTFMQAQAGNVIVIQSQPGMYIGLYTTQMDFWVAGTLPMNFVGGGSSLMRIAKSGSYTDIKIFGLPPSSTDALLRQSTNWQVWRDASTETIKREIEPLAERYPLANLIDTMAPIAYKEIDFITGHVKPHRYVGLSAEALDKTHPQLVTREEDGTPLGVLYDKVAVIAVAGVQDLRKRVAELEAIVKELKNG